MKLLDKVLFFSFMLSSCASVSNGPEGYGLLRGMVYDKDKNPIPMMVVSIKENEALEAKKIQTDINGRYSINNIKFGAVQIVFEKPNYEKYELNSLFDRNSQVFYAQIFHKDQLFNFAVQAFEEKEWATFKDLLVRGLHLDPENQIGLFLKSYELIHDGKITESLELLERLSKNNPNSDSILLLISDIYNDSLKDYENAKKYLLRALQLREDPKTRKKLENLGKN